MFRVIAQGQMNKKIKTGLFLFLVVTFVIAGLILWGLILMAKEDNS
jgi:CHASE3 domain sensor protein